MQKLRFPGVPVFLNGQNYYIPSLSLRDFRANYELLSKGMPEGATAAEVQERYNPIILLAVQRNYPDVTLEQLGDWLDLYTFNEALKAMQNASGTVPVTEGE